MSAEILDGATIREFVEDEAAFGRSVEDRFASLDANKDGKLSYEEMVRELMSLRVLETHFGMDGAGMTRDELLQLYLSLFARFDRDGNGAVDLEEFRGGDEGGDAGRGQWARLHAHPDGGGGR